MSTKPSQTHFHHSFSLYYPLWSASSLTCIANIVKYYAHIPVYCLLTSDRTSTEYFCVLWTLKKTNPFIFIEKIFLFCHVLNYAFFTDLFSYSCDNIIHISIYIYIYIYMCVCVCVCVYVCFWGFCDVIFNFVYRQCAREQILDVSDYIPNC